jgi:CO/xanthine dehydrogenase FAD-binding subunit
MGSYLRPTSLRDALAALAAGPRSILAGGTDHYPARATAPRDEDVLDITALPDLRRIVMQADHWFIPALATWSDLIAADLPEDFDGLKQAARQVGGVQVQNRGTLAGNICNASPAADGIPCLLAMDAEIVLASQDGTRIIPIENFLQGPRRTAKTAVELVLGVRIRVKKRPTRTLFRKLGGRRYLVISIAMVAAEFEYAPDHRIAAARIAVGACGPVATRLKALEAGLIGQHPHADLVRPEHLVALAPIDDIRAPAAYRMQAVLELLRRVVAA